MNHTIDEESTHLPDSQHTELSKICKQPEERVKGEGQDGELGSSHSQLLGIAESDSGCRELGSL